MSTKALTNSFQWDYQESFAQQDAQVSKTLLSFLSQEFMRVLFDAIEQSFEINQIYGAVEDIYAGESIDYIHC